MAVNIINASDSSNNCDSLPASEVTLNEEYTNVPIWLYSTNYWTMTSSNSNTHHVYSVYTGSNLVHCNAGYNGSNGTNGNIVAYGTRPVIVTLKSNIK